MINKMIDQVRRWVGKNNKVEYNSYNNTISVTFYPDPWATASEMADFFQATLPHLDGYTRHFRVDKIRIRDGCMVSRIELDAPEAEADE